MLNLVTIQIFVESKIALTGYPGNFFTFRELWNWLEIEVLEVPQRDAPLFKKVKMESYPSMHRRRLNKHRMDKKVAFNNTAKVKSLEITFCRASECQMLQNVTKSSLTCQITNIYKLCCNGKSTASPGSRGKKCFYNESKNMWQPASDVSSSKVMALEVMAYWSEWFLAE